MNVHLIYPIHTLQIKQNQAYQNNCHWYNLIILCKILKFLLTTLRKYQNIVSPGCQVSIVYSLGLSSSMLLIFLEIWINCWQWKCSVFFLWSHLPFPHCLLSSGSSVRSILTAGKRWVLTFNLLNKKVYYYNRIDIFGMQKHGVACKFV